MSESESDAKDADAPEKVKADAAEKKADAKEEKAPPKGRLQRLFADLGKVGIATYFVIFFGTWAGFITAIKFGFEVDSAAGDAGTIGAAYVATKLTQPIRIGATILLAPIVTAAWQRFRPSKTSDSAGA